MTNKSRLAVLVATLLLTLNAAAHPLEPSTSDETKPGLTHDEFLEVLSLNSTDGWEPMSRVPVYEIVEDGQVIDLGAGTSLLNKRGGDREFDAWGSGSGCDGPLRFSARNFGCGVCITASSYSSASSFGAGYLWRQTVEGKYPTAEWYSGRSCTGTKMHKQGILSKQWFSCDTASQWTGGNWAQSVMLYQGC